MNPPVGRVSSLTVGLTIVHTYNHLLVDTCIIEASRGLVKGLYILS